MTRRYLYHYLRKPSLLAIALVQPVLFVLLWTYVFSGAIQTPGGITYVDYLMPGLFILAIAFGSANTGVGLADDLARGLIDRFRALPMARPALLVGRTLADTARNTFVVLLMVAVGYTVGFRFHAGPAAALAALVLPLAVGYLLSWISALIGLTVRDPETAGTASLLPVIPLAFTSSTFVPVATMPGWLQTWANTNPITPRRGRHPRPGPRRLHQRPAAQGHRLDPRHPCRRDPPGHPPLPPGHPIAPWSAWLPTRPSRSPEASLLPGPLRASRRVPAVPSGAGSSWALPSTPAGGRRPGPASRSFPWKSSVKVTLDRMPSSSGSMVMLALGLSGPSTPRAAQLLGRIERRDLLRIAEFDAGDPAGRGEPRAPSGRPPWMRTPTTSSCHSAKREGSVAYPKTSAGGQAMSRWDTIGGIAPPCHIGSCWPVTVITDRDEEM